MGVFVFPTGSSSGGEDLPWHTVDLSSGWSSPTDPDGIISSASTTSGSGLTTFEYNAISSGSTAYTMASNAADLKVWRVSRALQFGGANLTGSDSVLIALEIDCSSGFVDDGATQIGLMLSKDPTSTTRATAGMCGIVEQHTGGAGAPDFVTISPTGAGTVLGNANNQIARAFFAVHAGAVTPVESIVTGNGNVYGPSGRDAGITFGSGDTLNLALVAGTRGSSTINAGDMAAAKMRWAVTRLGS